MGRAGDPVLFSNVYCRLKSDLYSGCTCYSPVSSDRTGISSGSGSPVAVEIQIERLESLRRAAREESRVERVDALAAVGRPRGL